MQAKSFVVELNRIAVQFETARVESIDRRKSPTLAQTSPETRFGGGAAPAGKVKG